MSKIQTEKCGTVGESETEILVPGTDLSIDLVTDEKFGDTHWWLLGASGEPLWIVSRDVAEGLISALKEWMLKHGGPAPDPDYPDPFEDA